MNPFGQESRVQTTVGHVPEGQWEVNQSYRVSVQNATSAGQEQAARKSRERNMTDQVASLDTCQVRSENTEPSHWATISANLDRKDCAQSHGHGASERGTGSSSEKDINSNSLACLPSASPLTAPQPIPTQLQRTGHCTWPRRSETSQRGTELAAEGDRPLYFHLAKKTSLSGCMLKVCGRKPPKIKALQSIGSFLFPFAALSVSLTVPPGWRAYR